MFNFTNYLHYNSDLKFNKSIISLYDINQLIDKYNKLHIFSNNGWFFIS